MTAFDPIEVVARIAPRPLLLIHGENDELINARHARLLYARAGEPKELWILRGLPHCRGLESAYEAYRDRIRAFFGRALRRADSAGADADDGPLAARSA
jgi:fermentation-respiration switch protein FrsA (DUF1100 family)